MKAYVVVDEAFLVIVDRADDFIHAVDLIAVGVPDLSSMPRVY